MENTTSPAKSGLVYGLLFGAIMILEFVIGYVMNIDPTTNKGYGITINLLNYLIFPFAFIFYGCNYYKMKLNSGFISFGNCLKIGVSVCIIAGLLFALFSATFNMIFPEYMEGVYRKVEILMSQTNPQLTEEQAKMGISMMKKFSSPAFVIPITLVMFAFIGLFHSLIVGAIVKKDPNQSF